MLNLAIDQIKDLQYLTGGMVMFLEAEEKEELMHFYIEENGFKQFDVREIVNNQEESHVLIQLLKVL